VVRSFYGLQFATKQLWNTTLLSDEEKRETVGEMKGKGFGFSLKFLQFQSDTPPKLDKAFVKKY
jgi:hypothetical protein